MIEVDVETKFIANESNVATNRYVFAYTITISNNGANKSQLMNRHWIITNGEGQKQEVHGPGVVGKQPSIAPGQSFRYTSAAVLETAVGTMEGYYEFQDANEETFNVPIEPFVLAMPNAVH